MKIADSTNSLAPEQYGSRTNHQAIDLEENKALTYDLLHQLKRPGVICSKDAVKHYLIPSCIKPNKRRVL